MWYFPTIAIAPPSTNAPPDFSPGIADTSYLCSAMVAPDHAYSAPVGLNGACRGEKPLVGEPQAGRVPLVAEDRDSGEFWGYLAIK